VLPLAKVAVIVLLTEAPAATETLPELPSEKSKPLVLANHALATELGFALFLKAWAFSNTSLEIVIGPEYLGDDCVGDEPSVV
jgi:hypothetical protein